MPRPARELTDLQRRCAAAMLLMRLRAGFTQRQMAEYMAAALNAGVSQVEVSRWERGIIVPLAPTLMAWMVICGFWPTDLDDDWSSYTAAIKVMQERLEMEPRPTLVEAATRIPPGTERHYIKVRDAAKELGITPWALYYRLGRNNPPPYRDARSKLRVRISDIGRIKNEREREQRREKNR